MGLIRGVVAVAEQVLRQAEREFFDPRRVRAQLEEVARQREEGLIDDRDAEAWEDTLVARLMEGQERAREGRHG